MRSIRKKRAEGVKILAARGLAIFPPKMIQKESVFGFYVDAQASSIIDIINILWLQFPLSGC